MKCREHGANLRIALKEKKPALTFYQRQTGSLSGTSESNQIGKQYLTEAAGSPDKSQDIWRLLSAVSDGTAQGYPTAFVMFLTLCEQRLHFAIARPFV